MRPSSQGRADVTVHSGAEAAICQAGWGGGRGISGGSSDTSCVHPEHLLPAPAGHTSE